MKAKYAIVAVTLLLTVVAGTSAAGEIDPGLQSILESTPPGEQVSVLVFLQEQVDVKSMDRDLTEQRATIQRRHETVVRTLQEKAANTQIELRRYLDNSKAAGRIDDFRTFWIANAIHVRATRQEIETLAHRSDVMRVYYDYELELIKPVDVGTGEPDAAAAVEPGVAAVRAPDVWAMGITGIGVLVANIDTGVEGSHPALADRWAGVADSRYAGHPEWAWYDPYLGQNDFPYDNNGHGTHTMGSICGGSPGDEVGVAPGAYWIAAGAIDRGGGIERTMSDAMLSFEWMLDPDGNPSTNWDVPDVCSNSWGVTTSHGYPPCDDTLWSYIDACEASGTVVLFSAGNEGTSGLRRPADRATDDYRNCAVAAVDANTAGWPIASFSSRGPTYCTPTGDPAIKPDIAAPGVSVRSAYPGGGYVSMSGTSMASPHVAGVVALMRQANPNIGVDQIKQIIYQTAYDLGPAGEDNDYGWGMIDAYEAVMLAMPDTLVANFYGTPLSGRAPMTVNFFDISIGDVTSWSWTFGDGGTSTLQDPSHDYMVPGTYTVSLTVTGPQGTDDEVKIDYIQVDTCYVPTADFTAAPTSGSYPLIVNFTDLSTNDPDSWSWDFGDGGTADVQNPTHTYAAAGAYTVSLTVTTPCGSDSEVKLDYITVTEPAFASLPYYTGFETGSLDEYWKAFSYDEGRILITTANTPRGAYHMTMDDYLDGGLYSLNEAWLRVNLAGLTNVDLTFWWKEFSDEDHVEDGVFFSDDGGVTFVKVHDLIAGTTIYQEIILDVDQLAALSGLSLTGTFVIKFQQYDNYGIATDGMAFDDVSVTAMEVPPVADFSGTPTSGVAPLTVNFTDLSTGNPTSWSWTFGDGGTSTVQNPSHEYTSVGTYTVSLTVINAYGSDTETKTDYIDVTEQPLENIHVADIVVSRYQSSKVHWSGRAAVTIVDETGAPVDGAMVYGFFNAPDTRTESGVTGADGVAIVESRKTKSPPGDWCFEVTDVVKAGETYEATENLVTRACESGWVYKFTMLPTDFTLEQNRPNPFNPTTEIGFTLPIGTHTTLDIYNIAGQLVATLIDGQLPAGRHSVEWNASAYPSGIYLYRLTAGDFTATKKLMLMK